MLGLVLVNAVVVAGDDAGADVGFLADLGVAEVGEVAGFDAGVPSFDFFGFDEVADVDVLADLASGAHTGEGTDVGTVGDGAVGQDAALANDDSLAQRAVLDHGIGPDGRVGADACACRAVAQRAR